MVQEDAQERYRQLAARMLNGTITPEEEAELLAWYDEDDGRPLEVPHSREALRARLLNNIQKDITPVIPMRARFVRLTAAAAVLAVISLTGWYFLKQTAATKPSAAGTEQLAQQDLQPGTDGAVLRLANGTTIVLDTAGNGLLAGSISKAGNSLIVGDADNKPAAGALHSLTTPRARQQQLVLPDGTHIWLNAESSIRFPAAFTGKTREVEITGEAYFEVAKDAGKPFIVHAQKTSVEVLGTHFNVMAYHNEPAIQTTLLEGAVKVNAGQQHLLLKPGQQGITNAAGEMKLIKDADTDMAVAWKNGEQVFRNTPLTAILRQVERWYDVDVVYTDKLPEDITFSGEVPRGVTLGELLRVFESNKLHFTINASQRTVTVTR